MKDYLNQPITWKKPSVAAPLNEHIGNQDFIALCESVRFRLDKPTSISRSERLNKIKYLEFRHSVSLGNFLRIHPQITPGALKSLQLVLNDFIDLPLQKHLLRLVMDNLMPVACWYHHNFLSG